MYPELQKELETFERRTPKSAEAHKRNLKRLPLGVASNYRAYDPYPIFVKEGQGSHFRDLDGNDYIDHNLCFGALMAGHCHPAVMKAVEKRLTTGTMFGMPHDMEWQLAEEICKRFPVEMVRFGSSGTEATMHAVRLARAATGRDKIVKFEGGYHGLHDSALVSVKPHAPDFGDIDNPVSVPGGLGVPKASIANVAIATFNDLSTVERRFQENPGQIAAIILEPILMNVGLCMPQPGFLQGLREIATKNGALLIFDEVKTNTNPVSMAAGLATFAEVLTRENYAHVDKLSKKLVDGYKKTIAKVGLQAYIAQAGANGALMLYPQEIRNYRDWLTVDVDVWRHYWFGMVNRGVMAQPYWQDEQWTISVQHTEADIDKHIAAFDDIAASVAKAQQERADKAPALAAH